MVKNGRARRGGRAPLPGATIIVLEEAEVGGTGEEEEEEEVHLSR